MVWTGSVLTGSSVSIGIISRCCINGWRRGVIVLCRCVGWRSTSRGRRLSARWVFRRWWNRVCQQALRQVLEPIFEPSWIPRERTCRRRQASSTPFGVPARLAAGDVGPADVIGEQGAVAQLDGM